VTAGIGERTYTISEAAALAGLPASTLRSYESIGVTAPEGTRAGGAAAGIPAHTQGRGERRDQPRRTARSRNPQQQSAPGAGPRPPAAEPQIALLSERAERPAAEATALVGQPKPAR
jgi:hypothetical protein